MATAERPPEPPAAPPPRTPPRTPPPSVAAPALADVARASGALEAEVDPFGYRLSEERLERPETD